MLMSSLVMVMGPVHVKSEAWLPVPVLCRDWVSRVVLLFSFTPMFVDVMPFAAPWVAVKVPPYDRNSTTSPYGLIRAKPSGSPFWKPGTLTLV